MTLTKVNSTVFLTTIMDYNYDNIAEMQTHQLDAALQLHVCICGIYVTDIDPARQEHFFVEQLRLARDFDLPVLLHVRRAVDVVLKQLRRFKVRGGIAHEIGRASCRERV